MKLIHNPLSPFARKVRVVSHELGIASQLQFTELTTAPTKSHPDLAAHNPLRKVPTLQLDDGSTLFDSRVIAEYLDSIAGPRLFPPTGPARWLALRRQALADGMMDASVAMRYEMALRPAEKQFEDWIAGQRIKVQGGLDALESEAGSLGGDVTIGQIAIACALGYLDLRFAQDNWRNARPALSAFYASFSERPSMRATQPPAA